MLDTKSITFTACFAMLLFLDTQCSLIVWLSATISNHQLVLFKSMEWPPNQEEQFGYNQQQPQTCVFQINGVASTSGGTIWPQSPTTTDLWLFQINGVASNSGGTVWLQLTTTTNLRCSNQWSGFRIRRNNLATINNNHNTVFSKLMEWPPNQEEQFGHN